MNTSSASHFFGIFREKIQPGVYRVRCKLCGVTGREHAPKIGGNYTATEARKAVRDHTEKHIDRAIEEHRDRCLAEVRQHGKS